MSDLEWIKEKVKMSKYEDNSLVRTIDQIKFYRELIDMPMNEAQKVQMLEEWFKIIQSEAKQEWGEDTLVELDATGTFIVETFNRRLEL